MSLRQTCFFQRFFANVAVGICLQVERERNIHIHSFIYFTMYFNQCISLSLSLSSPAFPTMCASDRHRKFASPTAKFVGTHSRCCVWRRNLHIHDLPLEIHTPGSHDQTTRNGELCFWALRTNHPSSRWETAWNPVCRVERVGRTKYHAFVDNRILSIHSQPTQYLSLPTPFLCSPSLTQGHISDLSFIHPRRFTLSFLLNPSLSVSLRLSSHLSIHTHTLMQTHLESDLSNLVTVASISPLFFSFLLLPLLMIWSSLPPYLPHPPYSSSSLIPLLLQFPGWIHADDSWLVPSIAAATATLLLDVD